MLPRGQTLPLDEFERRHRLLLGFLWLQLPLLTLYAAVHGYGPGHLALFALPIALSAFAASLPAASGRVRASAVAFGLLTAATIGVHISGGLIETNFYFFVMIVLLSLYEDWVPFLLALGYVLLHQVLVGVLDPNAAFNHGGSPWLWAGIHTSFVLTAGAAAMLAWRLNEDVRLKKDRARRALQTSEQRFRTLTGSAPVGIFESDQQGNCVYVNERFGELAGIDVADCLGKGWLVAVHRDDREDMAAERELGRRTDGEYALNFRFLRPDDSTVWVATITTPVRDEHGAISGYLGTVSDVSVLKRAEEELSRLALHDDLTGLANRRRFVESIEAHVSGAARYGWRGALLALDLDRFKLVNDTLGHAAGDELIVDTAYRLQARLRGSDFIARLGGDEFAVLLPDADADGARATAAALVDALAYRKNGNGNGNGGTVSDGGTVSVGIAMVDKAVSAADLMIRADVALYRAKDGGRNGFALYAVESDGQMPDLNARPG